MGTVRAPGELPEWVVCHQVTRDVAGVLVRCPTRGPILSDECLRCRFLTTSSVERTVGPWCELAETPAERLVALPIGPPALRPMGPATVGMPAVRPAPPVPSAHTIGT
jgi:hypothetical protein